MMAFEGWAQRRSGRAKKRPLHDDERVEPPTLPGSWVTVSEEELEEELSRRTSVTRARCKGDGCTSGSRAGDCMACSTGRARNGCKGDGCTSGSRAGNCVACSTGRARNGCKGDGCTSGSRAGNCVACSTGRARNGCEHGPRRLRSLCRQCWINGTGGRLRCEHNELPFQCSECDPLRAFNHAVQCSLRGKTKAPRKPRQLAPFLFSGGREADPDIQLYLLQLGKAIGATKANYGKARLRL